MFCCRKVTFKELWNFFEYCIAVRFAYEWHENRDNWFRSYGNENLELNKNGLMAKRYVGFITYPFHKKITSLDLSQFSSASLSLNGILAIKENNHGEETY